jgi:hypothetical protein
MKYLSEKRLSLLKEENALSSPELTASEVCHRLAPSEGQKENKWKKAFP